MCLHSATVRIVFFLLQGIIDDNREFFSGDHTYGSKFFFSYCYNLGESFFILTFSGLFFFWMKQVKSCNRLMWRLCIISQGINIVNQFACDICSIFLPLEIQPVITKVVDIWQILAQTFFILFSIIYPGLAFVRHTTRKKKPLLFLFFSLAFSLFHITVQALDFAEVDVSGTCFPLLVFATIVCEIIPSCFLIDSVRTTIHECDPEINEKTPILSQNHSEFSVKVEGGEENKSRLVPDENREDEASPSQIIFEGKPPKPTVSIEDDDEITAGSSFIVNISGYIKEDVERVVLNLPDDLVLQRDYDAQIVNDKNVYPQRVWNRKIHVKTTVAGDFVIDADGTYLRVTVGNPKVAVCFDGYDVIRAGEVFCISVKGCNQEWTETIKPQLGEGMSVVGDAGGNIDQGWARYAKLLYVRADIAGTHSIAILDKNDHDTVVGSPLQITVKPPKPYVSLEGAADLRLEGEFCVVVKGYDRSEVETGSALIPASMSFLRSQVEKGKFCNIHKCETWLNRLFVRAMAPGKFNILVKKEEGHEDFRGSPLHVFVKAPKPTVSIEGDDEIRAGGTFCICVKGYYREDVEGVSPVLPSDMTVLRPEIKSDEDKTDLPGFQTWYKKIYIRSTNARTSSIVVQDDAGCPIKGSPVRITVLPGPVLISASIVESCNHETPAVGHICVQSEAVRYIFSPRDEFDNIIPCDERLANQLSVECSTDLLILDKEPSGEKVRLFFLPLEEGDVEVRLMFNKTPVFSSPLSILTIPRPLKRAIMEDRIHVTNLRCSLVCSCEDKAGAVECDEKGRSVFVSVTPAAVTVKWNICSAGSFTLVRKSWPVNRALSLTVVDILEQRRYSVDEQKAFLDIREVGVGHMRLSMSKIDALKIAAITKHTLNNRYVGGSLDKRKEVLKERLQSKRVPFGQIEIHVKREDIISEAWRLFSSLREPGHLLAKIHVSFIGELGVDAGGLAKEYMTILQRDLFSPESGLWAPASSAIKLNSHPLPKLVMAAAAASKATDETEERRAADKRNKDLFAPLLPRADPSLNLSRRTGVSVENLYRLCGMVVSRTLSDCVREGTKPQLPFRLASSVFKHVLSLQVGYPDLERDDPDFYKSTVRQILDNDVEHLDITFSQDLFSLDNRYVRSVCIDPESDHYYALKTAMTADSVNPLDTKPVTEQNKMMFVDELAKYRLHGAMLPHLNEFREGFLHAIQEEDVALLTPDELVVVTCASTKIDVKDMMNHTVVRNPNPTLIDWFWQAINTFCETERRMFLFFATGNMCPPQGGFGMLNPPLKIVCLRVGSHNNLPNAHTCFNQLDLPPYTSYNELFSKLLMAINDGVDYYGMS